MVRQKTWSNSTWFG